MKNYILASDNKDELYDAFEPATTWKGQLPYTIIVNEKGEVVYREFGALSFLKMRRAIVPELEPHQAVGRVEPDQAQLKARARRSVRKTTPIRLLFMNRTGGECVRTLTETRDMTDAPDDVAALARLYGPTVFRAAWRILGSPGRRRGRATAVVPAAHRIAAARGGFLARVSDRLGSAHGDRLVAATAPFQTARAALEERKSPKNRPPTMRSAPKPRASCARRSRRSIPAMPRAS